MEKCPFALVASEEVYPLTLVISGEAPPILVASGDMSPYVGGQWRCGPLYWWSVEKCPLTLIISGDQSPCIGRKCKSVPPYIGEQCRRALLYWWSVEKYPYIDNQWRWVPLYWWSVKKWPVTLMVSGNGSSYIGHQWRQVAFIDWWWVQKWPFTLGVNGKRTPYINGQCRQEIHWPQFSPKRTPRNFWSNLSRHALKDLIYTAAVKVTGDMAPNIGGQQNCGPFYWWSLESTHLHW